MKETESTNLQLFSEQASVLLPLRAFIVERWLDLYLNTFGRSAFFSTQRVQKIFKELSDNFLDCLQTRNLDGYFESLEEKGAVFSKLGVPFEELIISLHLFEEVCTETFLRAFPDKNKLSVILNLSAELHSEGLAVLANSYFETFKEDVKQITDSLRDENNLLRQELQESQSKFFSISKNELASMQILVSGINLKMRNRLHHYGRLQKLSEIMDHESYLPKLLKLASLQIKSFCPKGSDAYFGFLSDDQKKINLYYLLDDRADEAELYRIFYLSELSHDVQGLVFDESQKILHINSSNNLPMPFKELISIRNQKDFVFLPIRKFREAQGFIFIAAHDEQFFCKNNMKFFQRAGQIASKAIVSSLLFSKTKKQEEYELLIEEINRKKYSKESVEMTLDFCLGSLMNLLGAERTSLMQYDAHRRELRVCAAKGYKVYPISGHAFKWGEGIAGTALKESKIISIPKLKDHHKNHFSESFLTAEDKHEIRLKSLLCVPIFESKLPLGVVNLSTINFYKDFDKTEIEMAHGVVNRMASILKDISLV